MKNSYSRVDFFDQLWVDRAYQSALIELNIWALTRHPRIDLFHQVGHGQQKQRLNNFNTVFSITISLE